MIIYKVPVQINNIDVSEKVHNLLIRICGTERVFVGKLVWVFEKSVAGRVDGLLGRGSSH